MGIFGEVKELYNDLSGKTRLEKARSDYESTVKRYNLIVECHNRNKEQLEEAINNNTEIKKDCLNLIQEYKNIFTTQKEINWDKYKFEEAEIHNMMYSSINTGGLGADITALVIGGGLSAFTYVLAGTFGVASTGTAIATLSGAAASNATLAVLGGGALSIGGGGMAAGISLLGGIAVAPLVWLELYKAFKRSEESDKLEITISNLNNDINRFKSDIDKMYETTKRIEKFNSSLGKLKKEYSDIMDKLIVAANVATDNFIKMLEDFSSIENGHLDTDIDQHMENYIKKRVKREEGFDKIAIKYVTEQLDAIIKN